MTEYDEQSTLFAWLEWYSNQHPEAALAYANVNGQYRPGQRPEPGLKAGVPDVFLPVARQGYHGLYIELKHGDNRPTAEQYTWILRLREQGYLAVVAYEFVGAKEVIESYLGGES
jgi:hypothetical protein